MRLSTFTIALPAIVLFLSATVINTQCQSIYGRYDFLRKYYDVDEKKIDISEEIILNLNEDHTYSYLVRDLSFVATDTGTYSVKEDTIYFKSKYSDSLMHARYDLILFDETMHDSQTIERLAEIDTTEWFYIRVEADIYLPLESGFQIKTQNFFFSYKGNSVGREYKLCEMYLPKKLMNAGEIGNMEIYFPDLRLIMNADSYKKIRKFNHAIIIRLQANDEEIPDEWFITPKTLYKQKAIMKDNNLLFIKRNGTVNDDIVLEK